MSFTAQPLDGSSTPIPLSSVVPDGTNTPIALEGGPSLSSGGNTLAPASIYVKDGNHVTIGALADSAATNNTSSWSVIALLKGIVGKLLASIAVTQSGSWTVQPGNTANTTAWLMTPQVTSSGGEIPYHNLSAATTNFTNVKGIACQMYGFDISNTSASIIFVKFYDKATTPATTDTPKRTVQIPANGTVLRAIPNGMKFVNGFGWAATGAVADNDNTAIAANCVIDFNLNS